MSIQSDEECPFEHHVEDKGDEEHGFNCSCLAEAGVCDTPVDCVEGKRPGGSVCDDRCGETSGLAAFTNHLR